MSDALDAAREILELKIAHERELREMQIAFEERARVFESWVKDFDKWRGDVVTRSDLASIEAEVRSHTQALNRFQGATWLLGFGGFAGVIAFLLALLRLAGLVR
jgi:chitinase